MVNSSLYLKNYHCKHVFDLVCAGHSRNIHFPFDIEGDTAMCVASEMVAELDLSDQDVTTIAEMIDAEILALVPEWRPGVAVDDGGQDPDTAYTTAADGSEVAGSDDTGIEEPPSCSWKARSMSPRYGFCYDVNGVMVTKSYGMGGVVASDDMPIWETWFILRCLIV